MKRERRRHVRVSVDIDVEVSVQIAKKGLGKITNLSESGLFVQTGLQVEKDNFIVIKLSDKQIMFGATVRRITESGFGAEFGCMTDSHREAIAEFHSKQGQADVSSTEVLPIIMLVGDSEAYSSLAIELKAAGYSVLEVRSIDRVFSSLERFNVIAIISDYVVGGKNTQTILERIKSTKRQPVILYSGRYDVPQDRFKEFGIPCFLKYNTPSKDIVCYISSKLADEDI